LQVGSAAGIYASSSSASQKQVNSLGKDAFLQLFVEQLKNQDPTSPQDTNTMINQMTQFSILEQLTNIAEDIAEAKLSEQMAEASALLDKQVTVQTSEGEISGQVEKVTRSGEGVMIFIGGTGYGMDQVTEIK
jgi:flagellar basal-body rod modification protein FlgD